MSWNRARVYSRTNLDELAPKNTTTMGRIKIAVASDTIETLALACINGQQVVPPFSVLYPVLKPIRYVSQYFARI
jgi:hypothetical protein